MNQPSRDPDQPGLRHDHGRLRITGDLIGEVSQTCAGNIALRIGRPLADDQQGWTQAAYVVLTADQAHDLVSVLIQRLDGLDLLALEVTPDDGDDSAAWASWSEANENRG